MTFFCFLWVPLFYFFWRSIRRCNVFGWAWALIAGSIIALIQFLLGPLVDPGGFGFSRWASGFVDIVVLPVLAPLLVYLLLFVFKLIGGTADFAGFALLWLIPGAAARAMAWSFHRDPILLVAVPVLWTAIAVGIPFFIRFIQDSRPLAIVLSSIAILAIPFAAASSYWALFYHRTFLGIILLIAAAAPMLMSIVFSILREGEQG